MKKKNGFTLIELLAVIVILAVIALIAVPQILNILNKARLNAAKDSTYGIIKAAETYATNFMLENNGSLPSEDIEFTCDGTNCNLKTTLTGYNLTNLDKLDFKGTKPKSGTIRISNNGKNIVAENLQINGFNCNYANDTATCTSSSNTPEPPIPVVTGPTSDNPVGEGYTNVLKIVYLDPTDLNKTCTASDVNSDTGTKTGCMKWYAYNDDGTNYTMLLDHNTTAITSNLNDRLTLLNTDTTGWNNSLNPRLMSEHEVRNIVGNNGTEEFHFETNQLEAPNPWPQPSKYGWLFDRTSSNCTIMGCLNNTTGSDYTLGYWTTDVLDDLSTAWCVGANGNMGVRNADINSFGLRPVITVEKSKID